VLRGTDRMKGIMFALSGTPIENTMFELHSQFDYA
jgi:SNF2 family DNA or RNA helicase